MNNTAKTRPQAGKFYRYGYKSLLCSVLGLFVLSFFNNCSEVPFETRSAEPPSLGDDSPQDSNSQLPRGSEPSPISGSEPGTPPPDPAPTASLPEPQPSLGAAFMAVGHVGTSMYSCDGGQTWEGYQSTDNDLRCWQAASGNVDCDHAASSSLGVTWGPDGFMATFGWGQPGSVVVTTDGSDWQTIDTGNTWAGVAYGNGYYILNSRRPIRSSNAGASWANAGELNFNPWNARKIDFVNQGSGIFVSQAQSGSVRDLMVSYDNGASFVRPGTLPEACANGVLAYSQNRIVIMAADVCTSDDQGATWVSRGAAPISAAQNLIYDGDSFKAYQGHQLYSSPDGVNWSQTSIGVSNPLNPGWNPRMAKVSYHSNTGQYVAISQSWGNFYEATEFLYSDDGRNWRRVNKAAGDAPAAPHPIRDIEPGYLEACGQ